MDFHAPTSRRDFLWRSGGGLGGIALGALTAGAQGVSPGETTALAGIRAPGPHHKPRATRVIQLFMAGAASALDLFDFKPELVKRGGQPSGLSGKIEAFQDGLGPWMAPVWPFKDYGRCGKKLSDVVAPLGAVVDEIAFVHNMAGKTGVHSQATYLQATGFQNPGFPGMGCWVSYGLGTLNQNLPTFVVLPDHRGFASNGTKNWDNSFLPGQHQGTIIRPGTPNPLPDLFAARPGWEKGDPAARELLRFADRRFADQRPEDARLESRIRSYELAAAMQLAAPEALDLSRETQEVLDLYGIQPAGTPFEREINIPEEADAMGRKCLVARRFLERGVRFVQIWSGCDNGFPRRNWDSHEDIRRDHGPLAAGMAKAVAGLLIDLKRTGLLEDTIVMWTTEFGRLPSSQGGKGRDHNPYCFTSWLAGGGIKGGISYGPSDDFGLGPIEPSKPTEVYDLHATVLDLLGLDHERLVFRSNGIDRRLTDVHGHIIKEIQA